MEVMDMTRLELMTLLLSLEALLEDGKTEKALEVRQMSSKNLKIFEKMYVLVNVHNSPETIRGFVMCTLHKKHDFQPVDRRAGGFFIFQTFGKLI